MPLGTPPRPGRFRFEFHTPIPTAGVDSDDAEACATVYQNIKDTVQDGMTRLSSSTEDGHLPVHGSEVRSAPRLASLRDRLASGVSGLFDDLIPF